MLFMQKLIKNKNLFNYFLIKKREIDCNKLNKFSNECKKAFYLFKHEIILLASCIIVCAVMIRQKSVKLRRINRDDKTKYFLLCIQIDYIHLLVCIHQKYTKIHYL